MAIREGASVVIVDSLKDAAVELPDDEVGALWNRAVQTTLAAGVEVLVLHHQRKGQQGSRPKAIDDVYGSRGSRQVPAPSCCSGDRLETPPSNWST